MQQGDLSNISPEALSKVPVHLVLCTERTGSSMLSGMLNESPEILCTSEQLFPLYFYKRYKNKTSWTEKEINQYVTEFVLMFERNIKMFYADPSLLAADLLAVKERLNYNLLIRITYFHFLDLKNKSGVKTIIDKQIAFLYFPELVKEVFPDSKILILTRDVRDNIVSRKKRGFNKSGNFQFLAGIWNDTYAQVYKFRNLYGNNLSVLRYEDLVGDPATELKRICGFFGVSYTDAMLKFNETFDKFLSAKENKVGTDYITWVREIHGSMLQPVFKDKVNSWEKEIDQITASEIAMVCLDAGKQIGYDFSHPFPPLKPRLSSQLRFLQAKLKRYYLIRFYMKIPLGIKLMIKRVKRKKSYVY